MKINVVVGTRAYPIHIRLSEDEAAPAAAELEEGAESLVIPTLGALRDAICDRANVDPAMLKIIHRGRTLAGDAADSITKFAFKEGDKLLILGRPKAALKDDPSFKKLLDYEKQNLVGMQKSYDELLTDLVELEKRFLDPPRHDEMSKRLEKRMKTFNELGSRHMIALDAIEMSTASASEEQVKRNREKRKALINGIESLLNQNDANLRRLEELVRKIVEEDEAKKKPLTK